VARALRNEPAEDNADGVGASLTEKCARVRVD
jgi:hypothetical protein